MKTISKFACIFVASSVASSQTIEVERRELSEVITGLKSPIDIVNDFISPLAYLKKLSVQNFNAKLDSHQRHQLAREMIRIHHLTQAFSDQSYFMDPDQYPVLKLLERNFQGFNQLPGEAGYNTRDVAEYFDKHPELWSR